MQLTVSQYVARFLKAQEIRSVFELSGGMIMHLLDAIQQEGGIDLVNVYHEQAAAFAADAVGRMSGKPGVAFGTSGPGAINLLTGVGSSFFDSSPTVFITGQVNRHEQKGSKGIRQLGFQETDIVAMAQPITKLAVRVTEPEQVIELLPKAFALATSGRPGSVLIDIPMDVFRAQIEVEDPLTSIAENDSETKEIKIESELTALASALARAKRPLILAGNGIRAAGANAELATFATHHSIPVVYSLLACDVMPADASLKVGMIGTYGNRWANLAVSESDLIVVLGSRLDIRQTGADTASFSQGRQIFHVDVEGEEINNRVKDCTPICCDLRSFFKQSLSLESTQAMGDRAAWISHIEDLRALWPDTAELEAADGINPNVLMRDLTRNRDIGAVCVDVGLHQMWAAQSVVMSPGCRFLTSGGMGAMGFALPAGIGAACWLQGTLPTLVIAGDAGFQLNIQELQVVAHHQLPVKIVIMNNRCHGMTRQFQDTYFASRYVGTVWGYSTPDFAAVGNAYGIPSRCLNNHADVAEMIDWLWADPTTPALLEVSIDLRTNAYPKMAFGKPMSEMEPFATPMEMEGT
jgi:acetolactate synthase I/II/III large subunit